MASLASLVTVSARQGACWRQCKGCTNLAPLAPAETHCRGCRAGHRPVSARRTLRAA
ncbi:hypothetical protein EDD30_3837 [Couchioplanes caeruleus]|uniref:Uncharacterized protein n=1 Tax=Couchioplanes caeruleus TaxID=56438 RepID=A0A3N1GL05_9ACTN|nr:hypothetical protein EDD30_3837 [Couchioplanes caeruleus]